MKIAVIGRGSVGGTLGRRWAGGGHAVTYGVRRPRAADEKAVADAARGAEVVLLAVPWGAAREALQACGDLAGKVLLDCTNPLQPDLAGLEVGLDTSAGERVAGWAPGARVVKIFNSTGANIMADPRGATMFLAGDDAAAKEQAAALAAELGFEPVDAGPLSAARVLEPLALLWISLAYRQGLGREIALVLQRRVT